VRRDQAAPGDSQALSSYPFTVTSWLPYFGASASLSAFF
jgi:hypothetical protein